MKKLLAILFLSFLWCETSNAEDYLICDWVVDEAYADVLKKYPKDKKYFYIVRGDDRRCEYGHGLDETSGFSDCEKHRKEKGIKGECKLFAIGKKKILKIKIEQPDCIKGNCTNGKGTMTWADGGKYVGQWKDGKEHGKGTMTRDGGKYVGQWKDGKEHGKGTMTWDDGGKYVGQWKDGKEHGKGTITWADGKKYVGKFKDGDMIEGVNTWPGGDKYVGEFKDGRGHGYGTYTWSSGEFAGDKYVGHWKNGFMHGQGTKTWANGSKYVGLWKNGKRHGEGTITLANGCIDNGIWDDDELVTEKKCKKDIEHIFDDQNSIKKRLIKKKDPTTFKELKFIRKTENKAFQGLQGLPDNCEDCNKFEEIIFDAYTFHAFYENDIKIIFLVNTEYKSFKKAEKLALKYAKTMGQLPAFLRESGIDRIVIHPGKRRWFVDRQEIIIYPDPGHKGPVKMLIHENAHLIDHRIIKDPDWEAAVNADDSKYITKYATTNPREDVAETILFWVALRCTDGISKKNKKKIIEGIPNRIVYLDKMNFNTANTLPMVCK